MFLKALWLTEFFGFCINRLEWSTGAMFITPPGWWHSHHNDSQEEAWVLPIQDAGLFTHQRTLDIRFAMDEIARNLAKENAKV